MPFLSCLWWQGREKINLLHAFVSLGVNVLISDVDVVWMRNPIEYMERVRGRGFLHLMTFVS